MVGNDCRGLYVFDVVRGVAVANAGPSPYIPFPTPVSSLATTGLAYNVTTVRPRCRRARVVRIAPPTPPCATNRAARPAAGNRACEDSVNRPLKKGFFPGDRQTTTPHRYYFGLLASKILEAGFQKSNTRCLGVLCRVGGTLVISAEADTSVRRRSFLSPVAVDTISRYFWRRKSKEAQ